MSEWTLISKFQSAFGYCASSKYLRTACGASPPRSNTIKKSVALSR
jgi:hypothetical protein